MLLAEHMRETEKDATFLFVGTGPLEKRLKGEAQKRGIAGRLVFAGGKDHNDALRYIKASDVLVVPSRIEGFGLSALEAAAMGVPVIASRTGALPDVLSAKSFSENLPGAVRKALHDRRFREALVRENLARSKKFSLRRMCSETEKVYAGNARGASPRAGKRA
jgi:glycosyltransferase involved in cell wall biosynthesis